MTPRSCLIGLVVVAVGLSGCSRPQPTLAPPPPPEVTVQTPIIQDVVRYEDFIGRTESKMWVELRSRVTGYLQSVHFTEGADVEAGQLLFVIDPKLYQAEVDRGEAAIKQAQAHLSRVEKDVERAETLAARGAISQEELDRVRGDLAESQAALDVAKAAKNLAVQNLNYTQIKAPFAGRISRRAVDPGNLIKADDTILTSLVQLNPIYAYFDVDDRTLLEIRRTSKDLIEPAMIDDDKPMAKPIQVEVGLSDRDGYEFMGTVNFFDNRVDPGTSTLRFRAQIDNSSGLLSPGLFVRVRLKLGILPNAILVPEEAIGSNQEHKFVYIVDADDTVREQRVTLGSQHDGQRVVKSGLKGNERIIVSGLQKVRPKAKVAIKPSTAVPNRTTPPSSPTPTSGPTTSNSLTPPSTPAPSIPSNGSVGGS